MKLIRIIRDFKANLAKNLVFILLVALSVTIIVGFNRSMDSYLDGVYDFWDKCTIEDGHFALSTPLSKSKLHKLNTTYNMTIEEYEQVDIDLAPKSSDDSIILRVLCMGKSLNKAALIEGSLPVAPDEIAIDPKFAQTNGYTIGNIITLSNITYKIVGYAISPDYVYTLKDTADLLNNPNCFGVAYLTSLGFKKVEDTHPPLTYYCYLDPHGQSDTLKEYLNDHAELSFFLTAHDNTRIKTVIDDVQSPKSIALMMGLLLVSIVAFIISISVKNTIAKESQTIGVLYSQGFNKTELLTYYLALPCILVILGILVGYPIGVKLSKPLTFIADAQYTIPTFTFKDTPFIFFTGVFLPLFVSMFITYRSLSAALNKTPISLLRGQHSSNKVTKLEKIFTFKFLPFFKRFRLKDMIREKASMISLLFGVFFAMFILLTGLYFQDTVLDYINTLTNEYPYECLYTFKSNTDLNKYSKQGEQIALGGYKISVNGKLRNISLYGLPEDSRFFDIPNLATLKDNEILIAPSITAKFHINVGETVELIDDADNKSYLAKIVGYSPYDVGLYFYTSTANYSRILKKHTLPYNSLLTDVPLNVDSDKVFSLTTKSEIISSTHNILEMISSLTGIMVIIGIAILTIVIYLLMNMIIKKSCINISMVKIFGYNPKEINKLYLNGNIFLIILGYIPGILAAKGLCNAFFTLAFSEMDNYMEPHIFTNSLIFAFILMLLGYWMSCFLLKRKVNKIALTEALKNRE